MIFNYAILFFSVLLTVAAQLLIKAGVGPLDSGRFSLGDPIGLIISILKNAYIMTGLVALGITFVLWVWLTSRMQLNILYAVVVSSQLIFLAFGSWLFFRETVSGAQLVGMAAILLGIFLVLKPN